MKLNWKAIGLLILASIVTSTMFNVLDPSDNLVVLKYAAQFFLGWMWPMPLYIPENKEEKKSNEEPTTKI